MGNYRAKYPLAIVSKMIDLFGDNLLCGYDIGCGFSKTADSSALVGPKKRRAGLKIICNSFHGHAHCRVCQLECHPMYIVDVGNEDFEGCERVFSESNRIAPCIRHATKFHRRQAILRHFARWNRDKYGELCKPSIHHTRATTNAYC